MTWVIGAPTMFGYSVGLADIQATIKFSDGSKKYFDSVQKLFPVGKFIAAGFSGSIEIGFFLIEDLKRWLLIPDETQAWMPNYVALKWRKRVKRLFSVIKPEKKNPVSLLLLGVHPQKDNGIPGQPKTYGCIMRSPDFELEPITSGLLGSIGSGNDVKQYKEALAKLSTGYNPLMQMEVGNPGGYGQSLAISLSLDVGRTPSLGISKHFHIAIIRRGSIRVGNNDHTETPMVGATIKVKMPLVAQNWEEFVKSMKSKGVNLAHAQALA